VARTTASFTQAHPVFTLAEAVRGLGLSGKTGRAVKRLKYQVARGYVKPVTRAVYATVPHGLVADRFQPDRYLVAAAVRSDGIFAYHSALELLGAAHSDWNVCTVFTKQRRRPIRLGSILVEFLPHPVALQRHDDERLGVRLVDRRGRTLAVTGPERSLVEGFRQPGKVGGVSELVESAAGYGVLDLTLLADVLEVYAERRLWAAVGWFLERYQARFFVPDEHLAKLEARRPKSPQYLLRSERGGRLLSRWNLILPESLARAGEPDEA
jgi:predicted transcriptional regulator of viral defense system